MIANEAEARAYVETRGGPEALSRLERLVAMLAKENQAHNLVAQATLPHVWTRHIADSAQLAAHVPDSSCRWLDLGSGAGFPGIVLAVLLPEASFDLVESRALRIAWLQRVIETLELTNCTVHGQTLAAVDPFPAGAITARAFAPLPKLLKLAGRFSTVETQWALPKGRSAAQEVADLPERTRAMFHVEQSQTDLQAGIIVGKGRVEAKA